MKDARFIELVNLYIDRQIGPEEAAELEAEIQAHPRRRAIYRQYCQMHRASKLVYESFRVNADAPAATAAQPGSIAYFAERRHRARRNFWLSTAAGLAAAAAVAFYFVRPQPAAVPQVAAASAPTPKAAVAAAQPTVAKPAVQPDYAAMFAAMRQAQPRPYALTPAPTVQPVSLFDDGVFENKPSVTTGPNGVTLTKGSTANRPPAEVTAFQFQR